MAGWIDQFLRDFRFGGRYLAKGRMFAAVTIGSLALGIGGSTAMYSVVYGVVLHPFIYKDVGRLMSVGMIEADGRSNGSYYAIDSFLDIAENNRIFSGIVASTWSDVTWMNGHEPRRIRGNHCTMNTFDVMGVPSLIGRTTIAADAEPGAQPVAILGYKFWQHEFNGDPSVVGRQLILNGKVRAVIGIMPGRFMWRGADVYLPDVFHRGQNVEGEPEVHLLGRLKPGFTRTQAEAALTGVLREIRRRIPNAPPGAWRVRLRSFEETFPSGITDALWILFGAVGVLLLIACLNVSNLLLSRLLVRQKEISIRASLGATRGSLIRQLLAESLVIAIGGGLLGVAVAEGALLGILAMVPPDTIPDEAQIALNAPVLAFALAVSLGAALIAGLAPALQFSAGDIISGLKEAGRSVSSSVRQRGLRAALVVFEVALSVMLLVGASLMIRTLISIGSADLGIRRGRILTMRIPFSGLRYPMPERRNAFLSAVLEKIAAAPGVIAVGLNTGLAPIGNWTMPVRVAGHERDARPVVVHQTNENYAGALGLTVIQGRFLYSGDVNGRLHNAVVNQAFTRRYLFAENALGSMASLPRLRTPPANLTDDSFRIVGILKDAVNRIPTHETIPEIYIPYTLAGMADRIYVASLTRPEALGPTVRDQVYAVDGGQPVTDVRTLDARLDDYVYAGPRFNLLLFAVFAALGLSLALLGVYGVVATAVAQRTREIGIRLALGAGIGQVIRMLIAFGARLLTLGVLAGLIGSALSVRTLKALVRNISTFDPVSFAAVSALLFAAGLLASFWPARRAARIDPANTLREE
jgi:putative ABC transport system permease protein